jgi:hypothetical protein
VIKSVSDLRQVGGFLRVHRFLPPINWPPRYNCNIVERGVKHHKSTKSEVVFWYTICVLLKIKVIRIYLHVIFQIFREIVNIFMSSSVLSYMTDNFWCTVCVKSVLKKHWYVVKKLSIHILFLNYHLSLFVMIRSENNLFILGDVLVEKYVL